MRPFISYAREDRDVALQIYEVLANAGAEPWIDVKCLRPGDEWELVITEALRNASHVVALISERSVNKRGFVQRELREALDLVSNMPPGEIFIIPVRLDRSEPRHPLLKKFHWVDLFDDHYLALERITTSIGVGRVPHVQPIHGADGKLLHVSDLRSVHADATRPNRASSRRMVHMGASLTIEMAQILSGMTSLVGQLQSNAAADERLSRPVGELMALVRRATHLVDTVSRFGKPEPLPRQWMRVAPWLSAIEAELRTFAGNHQLEIRMSDLDVEIFGDAEALAGVLRNVVENARDAIRRSGGEIVISAEGAVSPGAQREMFHIAISDNGIGIDPLVMKHLFDPFFSTKQSGKGLGLAVCAQVVAAHDGEMAVESIVGEGTTFHIYLPVARG